MIPRVVHRLWLGPDPMPDRYMAYGAAWEEYNPGWVVIDHGPELLRHSRNKHLLKQIEEQPNAGVPMPRGQAVAVQQADVLGYEILAEFGGVYLNTDIEPVMHGGLDHLIAGVGDAAWAAFEDDYFLVNAAMGGRSGHPFWRACVEELPIRYAGMPGRPMNETTGPHLLTAVWRHRQWGDLFVPLAAETFHFVHHGTIAAGGTAEDRLQAAADVGAVGLHHWGHRLTAEA